MGNKQLTQYTSVVHPLQTQVSVKEKDDLSAVMLLEVCEDVEHLSICPSLVDSPELQNPSQYSDEGLQL
jgi:hypothetical protein